ncbi:MAG: hypothetical protein GX638_12160 [Crenarchaeota archaeon]|nr:hypothetical protein [Thermoproteota archaeon]
MLVSILLVSIVAVFVVSAEPIANTKSVVSAEPNSSRGLGKGHVDISGVLKELGYADEDMSDIPSKLLVQIIRSYNVTPVGDIHRGFYLTITADSPRAEVNLIGSDRIAPYDLDLSHAPDGHDISDAQKSRDDSMNYELDQRAFLAFGIWDFDGTTIDLASAAEAEYDYITADISSTSAYDYWHFMENNDCTWYNVWAWITWACSMYNTVDIYWGGHGFEVNNEVGFVCYDAWNDSTLTLNFNLLYFADDFTTTQTYDYSTLRVGLGSLCYGEGFSNTFLNPGGSTSHERAYMSSDTEIEVDYTCEYIQTYSDEWYHDLVDSEDAHTEAAGAALPYLESGQNAFTYDDTGTPIFR